MTGPVSPAPRLGAVKAAAAPARRGSRAGCVAGGALQINAFKSDFELPEPHTPRGAPPRWTVRLDSACGTAKVFFCRAPPATNPPRGVGVIQRGTARCFFAQTRPTEPRPSLPDRHGRSACAGADQSPLWGGPEPSTCRLSGPQPRLASQPSPKDGGRWVNAGSEADHEPQVTSLGHEEAGCGVVVCVLAAGGLKRELGARQ